MKKSDFYYDLPKELIAQSPLADRSASRLLMLDRYTGETRHGRFSDLQAQLRRGDCLVLNDTRVLPARLIGEGARSGAAVELLLLKRITDDRWETLVRPGKRARPGDKIVFGDRLCAEIEEVLDDGNRIAVFSYEGIFEEILNELGEMPLPPYITEKLSDSERYQTVYAVNQGSAAAPTAGLHFTSKMLDEIRGSGVDIATLTLHVGLGTFRPVKVENVEEHLMHSEYYNLEGSQAEIINRCKRNGGRLIAVGTTSCRTLESCAMAMGSVEARSGYTDIFITPGYEFKAVDGLITNFHLPESTLIMLVSAFAGRENVLRAYAEAVEHKYRFFSFGDAMLVM